MKEIAESTKNASRAPPPAPAGSEMLDGCPNVPSVLDVLEAINQSKGGAAASEQ